MGATGASDSQVEVRESLRRGAGAAWVQAQVCVCVGGGGVGVQASVDRDRVSGRGTMSPTEVRAAHTGAVGCFRSGGGGGL